MATRAECGPDFQCVRSCVHLFFIDLFLYCLFLDASDSINAPHRLAEEATSINESYSQQVLRPDVAHRFDGPNPFFDASSAPEGQEPAAVGYRYRKWTLNEGVDMVKAFVIAGLSDVVSCFFLHRVLFLINKIAVPVHFVFEDCALRASCDRSEAKRSIGSYGGW